MEYSNYLRIGTSYYKKVKKPLVSGDHTENLLLWSSEIIRQDHGKAFLAGVPKYDGFCLVPSHLDYRQSVDNFYNLYHKFEHVPKKGYPKKTLQFLNHIFGEQLKLGIDYLKILLLKPTQRLPILCLVSSERNTGKTTFLNFLKALFGNNMTINSNEDFRSNFNAEWASKLIIGVDETFLDRVEDSERIKNLSTSQFYKMEAKGKDRYEIEFFGKFILCSNNETNFIIIDKLEIRYWIRKLPKLKFDNKDLLNELKEEIPFFLSYLIETPYSTQQVSRMWFKPELIKTAALKKVKDYYRNRLEYEMLNILIDIMESKELAEVCFSLSDIRDWLNRKGVGRYDSQKIRTVLQEEWKLQPESNSNSYQQYRMALDGSLYEYTYKGRFYTLEYNAALKLQNPDETDEV